MLLLINKRFVNSNRHKRYITIACGNVPRFNKLSFFLKRKDGRSKEGKIICAHRGGRKKSLYRIKNIFFRQVSGVALILSLIYNPFHNSFLTLLYFKGGVQTYVNATKNVSVGEAVIVGRKRIRIFDQTGCISSLFRIDYGSRVHHLELSPGKGSKYLRGAGMSGKLLKPIKVGYSRVRLASKRILSLSKFCAAMVGRAENVWYKKTVIGSAGRSRRLGHRPIVRGTAKNAVDHPHGGKSGPGRSAVTPWGKSTK